MPQEKQPTGHDGSGFKIIRDYWAVIATGAVALISLGGLQWQTGAQAGEIEHLSVEIEENAEDIEQIQRSLIRRQGEVELNLERLRIEQGQQTEKIDDVLLLLRQFQSNQQR